MKDVYKRQGLYHLEPFTKEDAKEVLSVIHKWQDRIYEQYGIHFIHAGDEWYLLAGQEVPEEERYDGYLQLENGVGMLRLLFEEFTEGYKSLTGDERQEELSIATGKLAYPYISAMAEKIEEKFPNLEIHVFSIRNDFFGERITAVSYTHLIDVQTQIAEHTEEIEQRKQEIMDLLGNRASTKAKIQHFDTTRDQISTRKSVLARNILEVSAKAKEQEEQLHEHEERLSEIQDKIRLYNMQITENEQKIQKLQEELNVRQEKLNVGRTAYHREASRLESLKNITERYDGYGNSIRKVMANKDKNPGLIGVVADIIKVDKEYEIAICLLYTSRCV